MFLQKIRYIINDYSRKISKRVVPIEIANEYNDYDVKRYLELLDSVNQEQRIKFALAFVNNHLEGFAPASANTLRETLGLGKLEFRDPKQKTVFDFK